MKRSDYLIYVSVPYYHMVLHESVQCSFLKKNRFCIIQSLIQGTKFQIYFRQTDQIGFRISQIDLNRINILREKDPITLHCVKIAINLYT